MTEPPDGCAKPAMSRSKVDLPESGAAQEADDLALRDLKLDAVEHYELAAVGFRE